MSYAEKAKAGASAPAPPAAASADVYGIQGHLVRVNVPSYSTGNGQAITKVTALLVVDLERKHLVLTSDLGGEMLFQIHQHRSKVELVANEARFSKAQCVERLRSFLLSKPDVDVCRVQTPFMDRVATMDHTVPTTVELQKPHMTICLFNENDPEPKPNVFVAAYLDKHIDVESKKYMGVETRFPVVKTDYSVSGHPNADISADINVSLSCLDVVRVYSTFEYDPTSEDLDEINYEDFKVGRNRGNRVKLQLKPASAQRLKAQIIDTLVKLAELNPLQDDECDADDWGCSDYVVGGYEVRHVVWIERDARNDGKYEIKREVYIKKSPTK